MALSGPTQSFRSSIAMNRMLGWLEGFEAELCADVFRLRPIPAREVNNNNRKEARGVFLTVGFRFMTEQNRQKSSMR